MSTDTNTDMGAVPLRMLYITSCTDPLMWYSDRVGQFVPLLRRLPEGGWGSQEPDGHRNIVKRLDAEEETVVAFLAHLGVWPYIQPTNKLVHIVSRDVAERAQKWPEQAGAMPGQVPKPAPWPTPPAQNGQCRDVCMLGSCKGLGDCREAQVKPPAPPPRPPNRLINEGVEIIGAGNEPPPTTAGQSRLGSMTETVANLVIGFVISVLITAAVLPWYGHAVTMQENIEITAIFTVASLVRTYVLRRLFNLFSSRA